MATKKNTKSEDSNNVEESIVQVKKYSKKAFLNSDELKTDKELLLILLQDGMKYSMQEVKELLIKYKNKEVRI